MKIALLGYGRMGQEVEQEALQRGHRIVARLHSRSRWEQEPWEQADLCIDFTQGPCVLEHAQRVLTAGKPLVIGTTGWFDQLPQLEQLVAIHKGSVLYGSNFSLGLHLFKAIVRYSCRLLKAFDYEAAGVEYHHSLKKDAPSGTALEIAQVAQQEQGVPLCFASVRCGSIPGTHSVLFGSSCDTLTLTHQAYHRRAFAQGALQAAEWLVERSGLYSFSDYMEQTLARLQ